MSTNYEAFKRHGVPLQPGLRAVQSDGVMQVEVSGQFPDVRLAFARREDTEEKVHRLLPVSI